MQCACFTIKTIHIKIKLLSLMKGVAPKSNLRGDTFVLHSGRGHGLILVHCGIVQHGVSDAGLVGQADRSVPFGLVVLPHMVV